MKTTTIKAGDLKPRDLFRRETDGEACMCLTKEGTRIGYIFDSLPYLYFLPNWFEVIPITAHQPINNNNLQPNAAQA